MDESVVAVDLESTACVKESCLLLCSTWIVFITHKVAARPGPLFLCKYVNAASHSTTTSVSLFFLNLN